MIDLVLVRRSLSRLCTLEELVAPIAMMIDCELVEEDFGVGRYAVPITCHCEDAKVFLLSIW